MMSEDAAITFWDVVKECLVEFHGLNYSEAHQKAAELRHRLRKADGPKTWFTQAIWRTTRNHFISRVTW
jgi:hypothetical protein